MIACRDVSFSYPASGPVDGECLTEGALKHITCTIEDGSFVLLCGASGCGKTTLTRLLNGLIPHYHEGTFTGSVQGITFYNDVALEKNVVAVSYTHLTLPTT